MYIRSRDQALDALAVVLNLPDRPSQIIEVTMRIALCLDYDPRLFLADCQAALIDGGLEALRKRRHEHLAALASRIAPAPPDEVAAAPRDAPSLAPEPPPSAEPVFAPARDGASLPFTPRMLLDPLLEDVGTALDLLRVVEIAQQVFPQLSKKRSKWILARFICSHEEDMRNRIVEALRFRNEPGRIAAMEGELLERIDRDTPWWSEWAGSLLEVCKSTVSTMRRADHLHPTANDPETLFHIIAMSEERARQLLDTLAHTPADAMAFVADIRMRVDWIQSAEGQG